MENKEWWVPLDVFGATKAAKRVSRCSRLSCRSAFLIISVVWICSMYVILYSGSIKTTFSLYQTTRAERWRTCQVKRTKEIEDWVAVDLAKRRDGKRERQLCTNRLDWSEKGINLTKWSWTIWPLGSYYRG